MRWPCAERTMQSKELAQVQQEGPEFGALDEVTGRGPHIRMPLCDLESPQHDRCVVVHVTHAKNLTDPQISLCERQVPAIVCIHALEGRVAPVHRGAIVPGW